MNKPHIARTFVAELQIPQNKTRGAWAWAVWKSKKDFVEQKEPLNWSLHGVFIRKTISALE